MKHNYWNNITAYVYYALLHRRRKSVEKLELLAHVYVVNRRVTVSDKNVSYSLCIAQRNNKVARYVKRSHDVCFMTCPLLVLLGDTTATQTSDCRWQNIKRCGAKMWIIGCCYANDCNADQIGVKRKTWLPIISTCSGLPCCRLTKISALLLSDKGSHRYMHSKHQTCYSPPERTRRI
jgi:hypothetical protein